MITVKHRGSFKKVEKFLNKMTTKRDYMSTLRRYGELGVNALQEATPKDTGKTASKWRYEIEKTNGGYTIYWLNSSTNDGVNIALLIQYGHGTGWGAYVQGIDYINPALKDVFDKMADDVWKEVQQA